MVTVTVTILVNITIQVNGEIMTERHFEMKEENGKVKEIVSNDLCEDCKKLFSKCVCSCMCNLCKIDSKLKYYGSFVSIMTKM